MSSRKHIKIEDVLSKGMVKPKTEVVDMGEIVKQSMMDYAEETIVNRAIQAIDGFKPVQRRVVYAMHELKLDKSDADYVKSAKIVGDTMAKYHPHGDSSIYGAACLMSDSNGSNNIPMIDGKGNLGLWYSTAEPAAMRYSEMKLTKFAGKCLEDINKGEVKFFKNELGEMEPEYIPVKFPYVLVNGANGVAVSIGSNIPSFKLENVCEATKAIIEDRNVSTEKLASLIGYPSYSGGGYIHKDEKQLHKLIEKGTGRFIFEGDGECYQNMIKITDVPHGTTVEEVIEDILKGIENGFFKGVSNVTNDIGYNTRGLTIYIKPGYKSKTVLEELLRLTSFRNPVSYTIRVVYEGVNVSTEIISVRKLLELWIKFRSDCIKRLNTKLLEDNSKEEARQSAWEKIGNRVKDLCRIIADSPEVDVFDNIKKEFGFTDEQAEYILGITLKNINDTRRNKALTDLAKLRQEIEVNKKLAESEEAREKLISFQLDECKSDFMTDGGTKLAEELTEEELDKPRRVISDELVNVVLSNTGCIKKVSLNSTGEVVDSTGAKEVKRWTVKNNGYLLIFDRFRNVTKVFVDDIEAGRGKFTMSLASLANVESVDDVLTVDVTSDFRGKFNIVYSRNKGYSIKYDKFSGRNKRYKAPYMELSRKPGVLFTKSDKFFIVTNKKRVVYCDAVNEGLMRDRSVFVTGRPGKDEFFSYIIDANEVPKYVSGEIDLYKYRRGYPVLPREDFEGVKGFEQ